MTDYADYQTPQAHADTISNTGVPLLSRPGSLVNLSGTIISGGQATILSNKAITKIGYEITLIFFAPASNQSIISVKLVWSDSVSGQITETDEWDFYAGSGPLANAHIIRGTGKTKGDTLTVTALQNVSTVTASFTVVMAENGRVYDKDNWHTETCGPITGITSLAGIFMPGNIVASTDNLAVAPSGSVTQALPLYAGRIVVSATTTSGTSDMTLIILDNTGTGGGLSDNQVLRGKTDANGNLVITSAALPRSQCVIQLINNNAAAKDLLAFITAVDN